MVLWGVLSIDVLNYRDLASSDEVLGKMKVLGLSSVMRLVSSVMNLRWCLNVSNFNGTLVGHGSGSRRGNASFGFCRLDSLVAHSHWSMLVHSTWLFVPNLVVQLIIHHLLVYLGDVNSSVVFRFALGVVVSIRTHYSRANVSSSLDGLSLLYLL